MVMLCKKSFCLIFLYLVIYITVVLNTVTLSAVFLSVLLARVLGWKALPGTNTLAYWAHLQVTKKLKCCDYPRPQVLFQEDKKGGKKFLFVNFKKWICLPMIKPREHYLKGKVQYY